MFCYRLTSVIEKVVVMPNYTKDNFLQSILLVETGNRAENSTNSDDNRQVHRLIYRLPSDKFFNSGVPQHENAGPSAASAPWIENDGIPSQQTGRQAGHSSSRVLNTQCYDPHMYEEVPHSHYRPRGILVEPPAQRHHFSAPN